MGTISDYERKVILFMACALLGASVLFYFLVLFIELKPDQNEIMASGMTYMRDIGMLLIGFYWGGSKGSKDKDTLLAQKIGNGATVDPAVK